LTPSYSAVLKAFSTKMKVAVFMRLRVRPVDWDPVWKLAVIAANQRSISVQPGQAYFDPGLFDPKTGQLDTFQEFRKTLEKAGIEDTVVAMVCRSDVAARLWATPLSLVFIDGGHTAEAALTDYECWARHILPGGYLLIHDIFKDPAEGGQAPHHIYNRALSSGHFDRLPMTKTLGMLQRKK
jgi:hypothetical protein